MCKEIVEVIFCVSRVGQFSRTFRIFVDSEGSDPRALREHMTANRSQIVAAHHGLISVEDVEAAALGMELLEASPTQLVIPADTPAEAGGAPVKVILQRGSTLDVYRFVHVLYGPTVV